VIVRPLKFFKDPSCYLVMEKAQGVGLDQVNLKSLSLREIKRIIRQLLEGVSYLHSVGVCHRDIKPDNLIFDFETGNVKLIDFNTANKITADSYSNEIRGGTGLKIWSAPETR
jgi:serine/threonine protein kinase